MNYNIANKFSKTYESAANFLDRENHKNVAELFHKSGYTCELATNKGMLFESIIIDEVRSVAEVKLFWGINVSEKHSNEVLQYIERINQYEEPVSYTGVDSSGRIYSFTELSYEMLEISIALFKSMEDACFSAIDVFSSSVIEINSEGKTKNDAFESMPVEELYPEPTLAQRHELMRAYLEMKHEI